MATFKTFVDAALLPLKMVFTPRHVGPDALRDPLKSLSDLSNPASGSGARYATSITTPNTIAQNASELGKTGKEMFVEMGSAMKNMLGSAKNGGQGAIGLVSNLGQKGANTFLKVATAILKAGKDNPVLAVIMAVGVTAGLTWHVIRGKSAKNYLNQEMDELNQREAVADTILAQTPQELAAARIATSNAVGQNNPQGDFVRNMGLNRSGGSPSLPSQ